MILGVKTSIAVAMVYLALTYGGTYVEKQTDNLQAVGVSEPAIGLVQGAFSEAGAAIGAAAVLMGITLPSVSARRREDEPPLLPDPSTG